MGFLRSRSDLASANGHAVEPGPRRPRDAGRAISQLGCFGTRTAGRCMGLLRRACDFATENGRATVPARRRPGGAARAARGQLRRVGSGTVGRCMGFVRWVGEFASATGRATDHGRCGPCDDGRTMHGQLRRVGTGTVGRCMGFVRWIGDFEFLAPPRQHASRLGRVSRAAVPHGASPSTAARSYAPGQSPPSTAPAPPPRPARIPGPLPAPWHAAAPPPRTAPERPVPRCMGVVLDHHVGRVRGVNRRLQLMRVIPPRRQVPWQIRVGVVRRGHQPGPAHQCPAPSAHRFRRRIAEPVRGVRRGQPCQPLRRPRPGALPTVHAAPAIPHRRRPTGLTRRSRLRPAARRQVRVAASAAVAMGTWRTAGMPRSIQAITTVAVGLAAVAIGRPALMADLPTVMPGPRVGRRPARVASTPAGKLTSGASPPAMPGCPRSCPGDAITASAEVTREVSVAVMEGICDLNVGG